MTKFKLFVTCPDEENVIKAVIDAAARAGAGTLGNYTHCAFITKGQGNFLPSQEANPHLGNVGEMTRVNEVKIEMDCWEKDAKDILAAIKAVHPYEEVAADFFKLETLA